MERIKAAAMVVHLVEWKDLPKVVPKVASREYCEAGN